MVEHLLGVLGRLSKKRILIIGDLMLDAYTKGSVRRISPEAPVTILQAEQTGYIPGGAGNVALNLMALGCEVALSGRVGDDFAGGQLRELLEDGHIDLSALVVESGYKTPIKNRFIANGQQLMRVDSETIVDMGSSYRADLLARLKKSLSDKQSRPDLIAISDYGKGLLSRTFLRVIIDLARGANIPLIVDPKGSDFSKYAGATLIKPNLSEARAAAKLPATASLPEIAAEIFRTCPIDQLLITRSEEGITVFYPDLRQFDAPIQARSVKDVTGAGDTVLATLCLALANGLSLEIAIVLANTAAAVAVQKLGCAQVSMSEIAAEVLQNNSGERVFDESHLFALKQILVEAESVALLLDPQEALLPLVVQLRALKELYPKSRIVVVLPETSGSGPFLLFLASLREVDFIVLTNSPDFVCKELQVSHVLTPTPSI